MKKVDSHTVLAVVSTIVGLAVTNGLITNSDGKVVTGFATAAVSLGLLIVSAVKHHAAGKQSVPPAA